ncbi:siderophore-interacting protein [Lichenicoccus sp.]|uniref:siderophore-interacting protein n=1 Tax=Lichenicoccus sp. TaxID=2781899 RepID=UPI003D0A219E
MNHVIRALRVRHQLKLRLVQVASVEQVTPRMRRMTFAGDELADFTSVAADDHVKLFFPAPGQDRPVLPNLADNQRAYPAGAIQPAIRDYTPRRFDTRQCTLVVEFVIHGSGPASTWAAQAKPGQWIGVGGPRGSVLAPDDEDTTLLMGDETALPAIARRLEEMRPGAGAVVLIEVADAGEERHLPTAANAAIHWLHRDRRAAGTTTLLEQALKRLVLPDGDTHAWLAAEIATARRLRRHLIEEKGLPRDRIRAAGYWRLGDAGTEAKLDD